MEEAAQVSNEPDFILITGDTCAHNLTSTNEVLQALMQVPNAKKKQKNKNKNKNKNNRKISISKMIEVTESIPRREHEAVLEVEHGNGEEVTLVNNSSGRSSLIRTCLLHGSVWLVEGSESGGGGVQVDMEVHRAFPDPTVKILYAIGESELFP